MRVITNCIRNHFSVLFVSVIDMPVMRGQSVLNPGDEVYSPHRQLLAVVYYMLCYVTRRGLRCFQFVLQLCFIIVVIIPKLCQFNADNRFSASEFFIGDNWTAANYNVIRNRSDDHLFGYWLALR